MRVHCIVMCFWVALAVIFASKVHADDDTLQVLGTGTVETENAGTTEMERGMDVFLPELNGKPIEFGSPLPYGYKWNVDGTLSMPNNVKVNRDGTLELPNNEYPENYKVQPDGSVVAPTGVKLKNKKPVKVDDVDEKNPFSIATALASLEKEIDKKRRESEIDSAKAEKPKEKPKEKQKKDNKFRIPKDAEKNKDLSFLTGCWKTDDKYGGTWDTNDIREISVRLCFDRNGRGQYNITDKRGVFSGPLTARLNNGKLSLKAGNAYAKGQIAYYTPSDMFCNGSGDNTRCQRIEVNPRNRRDVRYNTFVLTRSK